jgi:hypothetical protein
MKNESVIIFVDGSNLYLTPKPVRDSIAKAPLTATPIFAVFDPAIEKNLGVVGYSGIRKREGLKNIMAEIAKMRGGVPET